jgi:N utilization substance protein B
MASKFDRLRGSRIVVTQLIFQADFQGTPLEEVLRTYQTHFATLDDVEPSSIDPDYTAALIYGVLTNAQGIQDFLDHSAQEGWEISRMDSVLKSILKAGAAELLYPERKSPAPVVISEYVDIAKGFFDDKEASYVNKALDGLAKSLNLALTKS